VTTIDLTDWEAFIAEWRRVARPLKRMRAVRRGVNIITPEILGTFRSTTGDPVEISTGTSFTGGRLYGISYPEGDDRSRLVDNLDEVLAELEGGQP
jgi:hypothetical protein